LKLCPCQKDFKKCDDQITCVKYDAKKPEEFLTKCPCPEGHKKCDDGITCVPYDVKKP
jgi:hypothetical protein